ncbi:hypothetical protein SDC9_200331 [bioreactor metagenome]|uniref:Uncharacterized protein n=1 Tax=bioreactor metagenome TaxID=1076179 RepID=A0A645IQQ6_9ZZZZ
MRRKAAGAVEEARAFVEQKLAAVGLKTLHAHVEQMLALAKPPLYGGGVGKIGHQAVVEPPLRDAVGKAVRRLDHFTHVQILDRILIVVEAEVAANGLELGRLERGAERGLVLDLAADFLDCAVQQQGGIIGLGGVHGRDASVGLDKVGDEALVWCIFQVRGPL